ncbi:hypothetical protein NKI18_16375 [Mesorhizobium sp. M0800]
MVVSCGKASQLRLKQVSNLGNLSVAFMWGPTEDDIAPGAFHATAELADIEAAELAENGSHGMTSRDLWRHGHFAPRKPSGCGKDRQNSGRQSCHSEFIVGSFKVRNGLFSDWRLSYCGAI